MIEGDVVRVVDFVPQDWSTEAGEWRIAEQHMFECYLGKTGRVKAVDGWRIPFLVEFSDSARVPVREMRFHEGEVEAL